MKFGSTYEISKYAVTNYGLGWFCAVWAIVILTPLIYFPAPGILAGHPWKVELAMSFILFLVLAVYLLRKSSFILSIPPKILFWIVAPGGAMILWSATSALWANSELSVIHHTLVWAGYLIFFVLAINAAANKKLFTLFIVSLGLIIGIIATMCIVEYLFAVKIIEVFSVRYGKFAEINAALLPFFFSFLLRLNKRNLVLAGILTSLVWLAILFSTSRTSFLASIIGLFIFISLRIFSRTNFTEKKRIVIAFIGLAVIAGLIQIPIFSNTDQKTTTVTRLTSAQEDDPTNHIQQNIRVLFNKVGLEMIKDHPVKGIGADNFALEFNRYRAIFSADEANKANADQQEDRLPERAHNEYLQILTELGLIGGVIFLWFIFGIAKLAFADIKENRYKRANILTQAAAAGIITFLITSATSSYSFRLMQNGLVFFFLLAILLRNYVINNSRNPDKITASANFRSIAVPLAIVLSLGLTLFSVLKATSQYFVYEAEIQPDMNIAKPLYEKASRIDPANGSANYLLGSRMFQEGNYPESAANYQIAINKGLNTSVSYSLLTTSETLAKDEQGMDKTFAEAIKIFPYSTFLRVRYATALKIFGKQDESTRQFNIAKQLNSPMAETWWLLINEGEIVTRQKTFENKEMMQIENLDPPAAIDVVINERRTLHPEERRSFHD